MLNLIVFTCGAALMGLELVAARVLAPALGNSIYVWGSVISMVMLALSMGYWLGGQIADRWGPVRTLPAVIGGAALATVLAPLIAAPVLPWAGDLGPRLGSLGASALIFFVPALLIAMVSPLGVRLAAERGMAHIGRSAGGLYSISTAGSIVGTLLTAFWLIPLLSLEPLIVWIGVLLAVVSIAALALPGIASPNDSTSGPGLLRHFRLVTFTLVGATVAVGVSVLVGVASGPGVNEFGETVLFSQDTQYHRITVTEDELARHLRFDRGHQSAIDLADEYTSHIRYPDYLHLALAAKPDAQSVLVLGLGGGALSKRMWRDYPDMQVDSVEIDPVVVDVAERYFDLPQDERLHVFTEDGRRHVQRCEEKYDIVVVDAYYSDSLPYHMTTEEFFGEIKTILAPDGVVAYNVISALEGEQSELFRSMYRTVGGVFDETWVFGVQLAENPDLLRNRNIVVLATDTEIEREEMLARIESNLDGAVSVPGFERFGEDLYTGMVDMADVPVLTDSHAPTDSLIDVN